MKKSILLFGLFGCASEDSQFIDGFDPPDPASDEIQLVAPPVRAVPPGADITLCSYIAERLDVERDIVAYTAYQSHTGGHHTILYAVTREQAPNTHECTEDDMVNSRYLGGGGADSPAAALPEGVVFRMPANTQLMIQTHWINATDQPLDGQAAFNLKLAEPKAEHKPAQLFTVLSTDFVVPVGTGSASTECTVGQAMNVFMLGGHLHEWGTHAKITHTRASTSTATTIYETPWSEEYVFNPPRNHYNTDAPFTLAPGDKIRVDCEYNNTTAAPLPFPSEMCVGWAYAYPMTKQLDCVDGNWPR